MVKVAHVRLCHSRAFFLAAYPRESQEMVFDSHARAFEFFGGVPRRGIYDNLKPAVDAVFVGKDRQYNRRFLQMCSHHLVEPVACTPASGWEKGQVENQVGLVRERFFTPKPRFKSYDELNAWLLDRCLVFAKAHPHTEWPDRTIWEVFEEERPRLVPYRGRFDGFHALPALFESRGGFGRRDEADGLQKPAIVEPVHPLEGCELDGLEVAPRASSMDDLSLVEAVDRFGEGVVVRIADAADGRLDPGFGEPLGVLDRNILGAAIAMMNEAAAAGRPSVMERLFEGVQDEVRMRCPAGSPADDPPRISVDDEGDIDEAGPGRDVGRIASHRRSGAEAWNCRFP